jgi:CotS family spore coat protein
VNDKVTEILEQYDLQIKNTYRGRGAVICDTDKGLKLVREFTGSKYRLAFEYTLLKNLKDAGYLIDSYVLNKSAEPCTAAKDGSVYIVKDWFNGRECDVNKSYEICEAVKQLAKLHICMQRLPCIENYVPYNTYSNLKQDYEKHNRELKKIRSFVRDKRKKNEFELYFIRYYDTFLYQAVTVLDLLNRSQYDLFWNESIENHHICHGNYNHHNILFTDKEIAITNFERLSFDIQIRDMYLFMRKILEKNNWSIKLGEDMLNAYDSVKQITKNELETLSLMLLYPEKFWKITNYYYNSNKAWISERNLDKLNSIAKQNQNRLQFLEMVFGLKI